LLVGPAGLQQSSQLKHLAKAETARFHDVSQYLSHAIVSQPIVERDDGLWAIGWHEGAAGPFWTRDFAVADAAQEAAVAGK
jgi:hypothetical protein